MKKRRKQPIRAKVIRVMVEINYMLLKTVVVKNLKVKASVLKEMMRLQIINMALRNLQRQSLEMFLFLIPSQYLT